MPIPLWGAQAAGGKLVTLDDDAVVKDLTALAGTGGNSYSPYLITAPVGQGKGAGYAKVRRIVQRVPHDGAVTVTVTPWVDGADTGQTITRTLAASDNATVTAPLAKLGGVFAFKITLAAFDAPASLGSGDFTIIPLRSQR